MVTVYVEGGGDEASLKAECRRAFSELIEKAGFKGKMPSVKALGGRGSAFEAFRNAHRKTINGTFVLLLVDSEDVPNNFDPWAHLAARDGWDKPQGATDEQAHLMVVCMETWLLADPSAFEAYFGKEFKKAKLPTWELENRSKPQIVDAIRDATTVSRPKGKYGKARDSFKLLSMTDPTKLKSACKWAARFFDVLDKYS